MGSLREKFISMKNIFKRLWRLAVFIIVLSLGILPLTARVDAIEWAAAPVGVRFEGYDSYDSCLRALLISCGRRLVNWYALIHVTDTDGNKFEVPAIVRNVHEKNANPENWQTHEMMLFYDRLRSPDCMNFEIYQSKEGTSAANKVPIKIAVYTIDLYIPRPGSNCEVVFHTIPNSSPQPFNFDYYPNYCSFWLTKVYWGGSPRKVTDLRPDEAMFDKLCRMHTSG